ncbi:ankyrin repeat domain-containing protein 33B-like [Arapaima gigas]
MTSMAGGSCAKPKRVPHGSPGDDAKDNSAQAEDFSQRPTPEDESQRDAGEDDDDDDDIYQEFEEYEDFSDFPDTRSIASDDSFYPPDISVASLRSPSLESPEPISFFQACCNNNSVIVKVMIRQGVTEEEVMEMDKNNRTGLIVACYQGFVDVVIALAQCPYVDVNWQDKEGNTALITAAQAGHIMISNYLLNYFPGLDIERRNCHGFTAMMKAAMQGRADCVRALMLAGGDVEARDFGRKLTPREWALFTGRYETAALMSRLTARPCAEQFCDSYRLEWPALPDLVARARQPRSCFRRLSDWLRSAFCCTFRTKTDPQEDGVLDHAVRITTALRSPLVATACRTVCPGSPPCVGKRRPAVQEILRRQRLEELRGLGPERLEQYRRLFQNSRVLLLPRPRERRASLQPRVLRDAAMALRRSSLLPLHLMRRSSVRPGTVVPRVRVCKAPLPAYEPERPRRKADARLLQIPKWRYKELKEENKKMRANDRKRRLEPIARQLTKGRM